MVLYFGVYPHDPLISGLRGSWNEPGKARSAWGGTVQNYAIAASQRAPPPLPPPLLFHPWFASIWSTSFALSSRFLTHPSSNASPTASRQRVMCHDGRTFPGLYTITLLLRAHQQSGHRMQCFKSENSSWSDTTLIKLICSDQKLIVWFMETYSSTNQIVVFFILAISALLNAIDQFWLSQ